VVPNRNKNGRNMVWAVRRNREAGHEAWARWEKANYRAMTANGHAVAAEQQVDGYLAECTKLSTHHASLSLNIPASPPFTFIPPLTLKTEADQEPLGNR